METNYNIAKFNDMKVHDIGDIPIFMYWLIMGMANATHLDDRKTHLLT
jgi:hypothetical protein